jgi:hypothetical protein
MQQQPKTAFLSGTSTAIGELPDSLNAQGAVGD